jgi:hypothetical protein
MLPLLRFWPFVTAPRFKMRGINLLAAMAGLIARCYRRPLRDRQRQWSVAVGNEAIPGHKHEKHCVQTKVE